MPTIRLQCTCSGKPATTEYQDKKYGNGICIHNENKDGDKATCTCCGSEKNISGLDKKEIE